MNTDNARQAFQDSLDTNKNLDGFERLNIAMTAMATEFLKDAPMWMRFNYIMNKLAIAKQRGELSNIDWIKVNSILTTNIGKYDFNNFDELKSIEDVDSARFACIAAGEGLGAFRKGICKDCGAVFYMNIGEVNNFQRKDLEIPKRCKPCRDVRRGIPKHDEIAQRKNDISVVPTNDHTETAMEIAMRKAGLIK